MFAFLYSQFFFLIAVNFVSQHFAYAGISIKWSLANYLIYNLPVLIYTFISVAVSRTKSIVLFIYFVFIFCPTVLLSLDKDYFLDTFLIVMIFPVVFIVIDSIKIRIVNKSVIKIKYEHFVWFTCLLTTAFILVDLDFSVFSNLQKIYSSREEVLTNSVFHSISTLASKVLLPIVLVLSLYHRDRRKVFLIYILFILLFVTYTHRSYLFYPFVIHLFCYFKFKNINESNMFYLALSGLFLLLVLAYQFYQDLYLSSIIIRRGIFIPSILTLDYYEFFSKEGFYYWKNSIFSIWDLSSYTKPISTIIANTKGMESGANTGFVGSGYAQAGLLGVFIYSLLFSLIIKLVTDKQYSNIKGLYLLALIPLLFSSIVNSDLLITLGTHGLLYFVIIVLLLKIEPKVVR